MTNDLVIMTAGTGLLSALATGLGAFPVSLANMDSPKLRGASTAFAAGMMIGASLFLLPEGLEQNATSTVLGVLLGAMAVWLAERYLDKPETSTVTRQSRRGLLLFLVMFFTLDPGRHGYRSRIRHRRSQFWIDHGVSDFDPQHP